MIKYDFYEYQEDKDKINIYSEELQFFFQNAFGLNIESIDFDPNQNVVLYIEHNTKINSELIEKYLVDKIEHLNDVEIRNMKIILIFDSKEIEIY